MGRERTRIAAVMAGLAGVAMLWAMPTAADAASPVPVSALAEALVIHSEVASAPYLRLEGFVTNRSAYDLQNVRLRVEALDAAGRPVADTSGWVFGDVVSGGRGFFVIALPARGHTYRVTVASFDLLAAPPRPGDRRPGEPRPDEPIQAP